MRGSGAAPSPVWSIGPSREDSGLSGAALEPEGPRSCPSATPVPYSGGQAAVLVPLGVEATPHHPLTNPGHYTNKWLLGWRPPHTTGGLPWPPYQQAAIRVPPKGGGGAPTADHHPHGPTLSVSTRTQASSGAGQEPGGVSG